MHHVRPGGYYYHIFFECAYGLGNRKALVSWLCILQIKKLRENNYDVQQCTDFLPEWCAVIYMYNIA